MNTACSTDWCAQNNEIIAVDRLYGRTLLQSWHWRKKENCSLLSFHAQKLLQTTCSLDRLWSGVRSYAQSGCNVLAKFWHLVGCSKRLHWWLKVTSGTIAFRICKACYRWKSTVLPGKLFFSKKTPQNSLFWRQWIRGILTLGGAVCQTIGTTSTSGVPLKSLGCNGSN